MSIFDKIAMKIVQSIGGHLLTRELTYENFKSYAEAILKLWGKGHKLIVVTGGGKTTREYQTIAREAGVDNVWLDRIGTIPTHLNAITLAAILGKEAHYVAWKPRNEDAIKEVKKYFGKKIVVCGGYEPGHSTDFDAAMFAEAVKADMLINATKVDGIYSADPEKDHNARKYERLTHDELLEIVLKNPQLPGEYRLFDLKATKLIRKLKLKTISIDGREPEEIIRAVEGRHHGTVVE